MVQWNNSGCDHITTARAFSLDKIYENHVYKTTTQLPRETVIFETAYTEDYAEQFQYLPISFDGKTADGKQLGCSQPQCLR